VETLIATQQLCSDLQSKQRVTMKNPLKHILFLVDTDALLQ
jgi:hypothetical protein